MTNCDEEDLDFLSNMREYGVSLAQGLWELLELSNLPKQHLSGSSNFLGSLEPTMHIRNFHWITCISQLTIRHSFDPRLKDFAIEAIVWQYNKLMRRAKELEKNHLISGIEIDDEHEDICGYSLPYLREAYELLTSKSAPPFREEMQL